MSLPRWLRTPAVPTPAPMVAPTAAPNSATRDGADDRADAGGGADLLHVAFGRICSLHAAFLIDLAHTLAATVRNNFNHLGTHL